MTATELLNGLDDILQIIVKYYGILIVLVILQLITNLTIILQLPKIRQCNEEILQKLYQTTDKSFKRYKLKKNEPKLSPKSVEEKVEILRTIYNNNENY